MRDPVIALVADMRTSYANGGEVGLLLDRVADIGPISKAGIRALLDFLEEVGDDLFLDHRDAVLDALEEVKLSYSALLEAEDLLDELQQGHLA